MPKMKRVGLGLLLSLPLLCAAATGNVVKSEQELYEECSAYSQAGMKECLAKKASESLQSLKQAEVEVLAALSRWDEGSRYIRVSIAALAASSEEFEKYRKAQCEFTASLSGGGAGNAHEMGRLACMAELNNRRSQQLRGAVVNLPAK